MTGLPPHITKRYTPIQELGETRWSIVYKVHDSETGDRVALKILKDPDDAMATLLEGEYAHLRDLEGHRHIVQVFDFGREDGRPFITMELVEGEDLLKFALGRAGDPRWPELCARLLVQVLGALAHMHARGVVHRDIKPSNVRVELNPPSPPMAKMLDFGLATRNPEAEEVGTLEFMAPEALRRDLFLGPGEEVDYRGDLYSVGVLAYMALGGGIYPSGRTAPRSIAEIRADLDRSVPTLRFADSVPAGLADVVVQLLERRRALRQAGAMDVIEQIAEVYPSLDTAGMQRPGSTGRFRYQEPGGRLEDVLSMAERTLSGIVEVRGGRGSGKTRFLAEAAARFRLDRRTQPEVIETRFSRTGELTWGPLDRIPRRVRALHSDRDVELSDAYPSLLGRTDGPVDIEDPGQHLEDQFVGLLAMQLRERSLVVTIDDAASADGSLAVVLAACVRVIRQLAERQRYLLVIIAVDEGAPRHVLDLVGHHRKMTERSTVIELEPFSREEMRGFLERNWDWEPEAQRQVLDLLESEAGGIPGRVEDVMRRIEGERTRGTSPRMLDVSTELLDRLRGTSREPDALLREKLACLTPEERSVLEVVAVAIRHVTARDLTALCPPLDAGVVDGALARLDQMGLVRRSVEDFQLWMDESPREIAYAAIEPSTRRLIHKRVGLHLEEKYRDNLPDRYDALAFNFARSGDGEAGRKYAQRAAERFVEKNQEHRAIPRYIDAIALHEELLREQPSTAGRTKATLVRLHLGLARAMLATSRAGEFGGASTNLGAARRLADELHEPILSARCVELATEIEFLRWSHIEGETPEDRRRCRLELERQIQALAARDDAEAQGLRAELLVQLARIHGREKSLPDAERFLREALAIGRRLGMRNLNRVMSQLAMVLTMMERSEGRTTAEEALDLARRERDRIGLSEAHRQLALALHLLEIRLEDADVELRNAAAVAEELHVTPQLRLIYLAHADLLALMGQGERALERAQRVLAFEGKGSVTARASQIAGRALYLLSRYGEADEALGCCIEYAESRHDSSALIRVLALEARAFRGRILVELGREDDGKKALDDVIQAAASIPGQLMQPAECYLSLAWHEVRKAWQARLAGDDDGHAYGTRIASLCASRQALAADLDVEEDQRASALAACGMALSGDAEAWRSGLAAVERAVKSGVQFRVVWSALFGGLAAFFNRQFRHAETALDLGAEALRKTEAAEVFIHTNLLLMLINQKLVRDPMAALRFRRECIKRMKEVRRHLHDDQARSYLTDPLRSIAMKGMAT